MIWNLENLELIRLSFYAWKKPTMKRFQEKGMRLEYMTVYISVWCSIIWQKKDILKITFLYKIDLQTVKKPTILRRFS